MRPNRIHNVSMIASIANEAQIENQHKYTMTHTNTLFSIHHIFYAIEQCENHIQCPVHQHSTINNVVA